MCGNRENFTINISRARLIICTIFGENQIFRVLRQKNRRVIKCHVSSKVTHACFQLVKTGKEQFQVKVSRQALCLLACLSLYFPSYQSYQLVSTQNQRLDPANYALFPDRRSYFYRSLYDHQFTVAIVSSIDFAPTSKTQDARHYAINIACLYRSCVNNNLQEELKS